MKVGFPLHPRCHVFPVIVPEGTRLIVCESITRDVCVLNHWGLRKPGDSFAEVYNVALMQKSPSNVWRSEGRAPLTAPRCEGSKQHLDENLNNKPWSDRLFKRRVWWLSTVFVVVVFGGTVSGGGLLFVVFRVHEKVAVECGAGCKSNMTMWPDDDSRTSVWLTGQPVLSPCYFWHPCLWHKHKHTHFCFDCEVKMTLPCLSSCHKTTISHKSTVNDSKQAGVLL